MDESANVAQLLIGMIEAGTLPINSKMSKQLLRILKQWMLYRELAADELGQLDAIYDKLTPRERQIWPLLLKSKRVSFESLRIQMLDSSSDPSMVTKLKRLRRKLDASEYWFEISTTNSEITWVRRAGKTI